MNTQIMAIFVLALTGTCIGNEVWKFTYDQKINFTCSGSKFLNFVKSEHNNPHEDRKWEFMCWDTDYFIMSDPNCHWSGYVNEYDQPAIFQCLNNGIIRGIESIHNSGYEDRRWNYYCCHSTGYRITDCDYTYQLNKLEGPLEVFVPHGHILYGAISVHDQKKEDRVFWFEFCRIENDPKNY